MLANIIRNAQKSFSGDPYYSAVSLLLHMDGSNASTNFVDSGPNALAVTATGATVSTTQSKFGGASLLVPNTSSYVSLGAQSQFAFGTGDFTIEMWIHFTNSVSNTNFIDFRPSAGNGAYPAMYVNPQFIYFANTSNRITGTTTPNLNQWYHVALCRNAGSTRLFVNGVQEGVTYADSTNYLVSRGPIIGNGWNLSGTGMTGYIDDLRITKGVARYTANFTPPSKAFPDLYNPYTTLPVSGAALWLDASQQNTIFTDAGTTPVTTSGQSVYQWNDLSGNNRHAVQATSGNRPTWLPPASGQNGLGAISFGGTSIGMTGPWANFDPLTLYVVFKWSSGYFASRIFTWSDNSTEDATVSSGSQSYVPLTVTNSPSLPSITSYYPASTSATGVTQGPGSAFTSGAWVRIRHQRSGTSIGNSVNSGTASSATMGSTVTKAISQYIIGRKFLGTDQSITASYAEVIAYNSILSSTDEAKVVAYLQTKWGTP